jgi:hypothetical protein
MMERRNGDRSLDISSTAELFAPSRIYTAAIATIPNI